MRTDKHATPIAIAMLLASLGSGAAWAGGPDAAASAVFPAATARTDTDDWHAVDDHRLEQIRGGFDLGGGLLASFGIERQVFVNGALVSATSLQIPDIARLTSAQAAALAATVGSIQWVRNGVDNSVDVASLNGVGATLIQNSLDNQQIQGLTTLNVGVNNLSELRGMNLQDSLQSAALLGSRGQ